MWDFYLMMNIEQGIMNDKVISKTLESYSLPLRGRARDGAFNLAAISFVCLQVNAYEDDRHPARHLHRN